MKTSRNGGKTSTLFFAAGIVILTIGKMYYYHYLNQLPATPSWVHIIIMFLLLIIMVTGGLMAIKFLMKNDTENTDNQK